MNALAIYQADNDGTHYSTVAALTAGNFSVIGTAGICDPEGEGAGGVGAAPAIEVTR